MSCTHCEILANVQTIADLRTYITVVTASCSETEETALLGIGVEVARARHLVQTVEVMVLKTVETVLVVWMTWLPPDITVCVTGQVVT